MILSDSIIYNVLIPLISLSGLILGIILAHLAKEEIAEGEKYLVLLYRILFVLLCIIISYYLSVGLILSFLVLFTILFILDLKIHNFKVRKILYSFNYSLFMVSYFLSGKQVLIAALIFLYGLPVGTIVSNK